MSCTRVFRILALCIACLVTAAFGQTREFNIPGGELKVALDVYARQSGVQLIYRVEDVSGVKSKGASGSLSNEEALARVLEGTGFSSHRDSSGAIAVVRAASKPAETRPSSAETKELIMVTAQKRDERAFDVPISIVALSADELQKRKINSLDDLSSAVPGLAILSAGDQRRIMLRGISNLVGNSSLIGLYLDEASVTSSPYNQLDLRTYDLERVEVLRGPQGTLYGEGSVGGTIRFITKYPQLDRFAMKTDVAALFTQSGAPGQRIESVINVPLIDNELGLRIAGTFDHQGGWINQPAAGRTNVNDQNLVNVRVKGLWKPTSQFTASATAVVHRNDAGLSRGEDATGNYTQTFNLTTTPSLKDKYEIYNLMLTYDFSDIRVLSTTSYIHQDKRIANFAYRLPLRAPPAPRFDLYEPLIAAGTNSRSEELRLTSIGSGPWQWTVGGFYRDFQFDNGVPIIFFGLPGPPGTALPRPFPGSTSSLSKSWAVFGDTSYKLTDRFTLGAGLRNFEDKQQFTNTAAVRQTGTFHALNPRAYAQYEVTDRINIYASAAKGFRSGGFNNLNQPTYGPESVWTYELGTKMSLLPGGHLYAEAAVFYSDYTNYQIVGILPPPAAPLSITSNAGNAKIKGIEWALTWRPADQWNLNFSGNYLNSKFYEINVTRSAYTVGDPLDLIPKYMYTVSAQRDFQWNGRTGFVRLDYNKQGRMTYGALRSIGPWYYSKSDVIDMLNFNMNLRWSDSLSLGVFAQNLLNDRGFNTPQSVDDLATRSRPRTFGIGFNVAF